MERRIRIGVDVVELHRQKIRALPDFAAQRQKLRIARHELQAFGNGGERPVAVAEVRPQLPELEPPPGIAGLFDHGPFRMGLRLFDPAAVKQAAGHAVEPASAAAGGALRGAQRKHRLRVAFVLILIEERMRELERHLKIGPRFGLAEAPGRNLLGNALLDVLRDAPGIDRRAVVETRQVGAVLIRQYALLFRRHLRLFEPSDRLDDPTPTSRTQNRPRAGRAQRAA